MDEQKNLSDILTGTRRDLESSLTLTSAPSKTTLINIVLVVLVVAACIVSFVDLNFSFQSIRKITAMAVFLYVATVAIYRNQYTKGKIRGKDDDEFKAAVAEYNKTRSEIYDARATKRIGEYCQHYARTELEEYKQALLLGTNITYSEYVEKYEGKPSRYIYKLKELPWHYRRILVKANRSKPVVMNSASLLTDRGSSRRGKMLTESGTHRETRDMITAMTTRAAMTIFAGVVAVDLLTSFSWQLVVLWIVRMIPVLTAIIMGETAGYCNITVTELRFKKAQTSCLHLFQEYLRITPLPVNDQVPSGDVHYD